MSDDDDTQGMGLEALEEQASLQVRKVMHEGRWLFSVIDVVGPLAETTSARRYGSDLERKLSHRPHALKGRRLAATP